uniref:Uncharacterized protein n=1 Tax=Anguilla anguilla TaxID=7936 RepID=A0A0E9X778_ANGAN
MKCMNANHARRPLCLCVKWGFDRAAAASFTLAKGREVEHYCQLKEAVLDVGTIFWKHTDTGGLGRISVELLGLDAVGPLDLTPPSPLLRTSLF